MLDNLETLGGAPIKSWRPGDALEAGVVPRVEWSWDNEDENWLDLWAAFLETPGVEKLSALVVGDWGESFEADSTPLVEALVAAREKLPNLTQLFIGDIASEQNEVSWIQQSDLSPLLAAFPNLTYFGARGGTNLQLGSPHHDHLKTLVIEAGGLDGAFVRDLLRAELPQLEHLELYLGTNEYGGTTTADDLRPLLDGKVFPNLRYLGLRDCDWADVLAQVIADASILHRIETLDLSLGTLGDEGAQALLDSEGVKKLKKLDLHYHFCTDAMQKKLQELPLEVDVSDAQSGDEWGGEVHRYVAVAE